MAKLKGALPGAFLMQTLFSDSPRCDEMGPELVYVSGRKRPPGEMNGKSGNLNNVVSQLYPPGCVIPTQELLCVFDADQVFSRSSCR